MAEMVRPSALSMPCPKIIMNTEQISRGSAPTSSTLSKTLPSCRCQRPPRQRNPPPINRRTRTAHPLRHNRHGLGSHYLRHSTRQPRPQQRSLHRQHPANRPQNPHSLRSRQQQRNHLRLPQNHPQLTPIPRRLISRSPHQPAKPTRPSQRTRSAHPADRVRHNPPASTRPRPTPPKPARLKPRRQPLHFPADVAQPPIQQHHQHLAQQPPTTPAAHRPAQSADHDRQVQIRGRGCR
jgi:hypothetical protein